MSCHVRIAIRQLKSALIAAVLLLPATVAYGAGEPNDLPPGAVARLASSKFRHGEVILGMAFSPDERLIASRSDNKIRIWEMPSGKLVREITWKSELPQPKWQRRNVSGPTLCFSGDGSILALADADTSTYRLWNIKAGKELPVFSMNVKKAPRFRFGGTGNSGPFLITPDGSHIVICSGEFVILQPLVKKNEAKRLSGHTDEIQALAVSPDGKTLAAASADRRLYLWNVSSGKLRTILRGHRAEVVSVCYSPDGKQILSASNDGTLRLWDNSTGKLKWRSFWTPGSLPAADSPDSNRLSSLLNSRLTNSSVDYIWFNAKTNRVGCLYETARTSRYGSTQVVAEFDANNGARLSSRIFGEGTVNAPRVSALLSDRFGLNGGVIAIAGGRKILARAASSSHHIHFFSLATARQTFNKDGLRSGVSDVAAFGERIAVTRENDPTIFLWNWRGGAIQHLRGHTGQPMLARSAPGNLMLSFSRDSSDRMLSVWNIHKGVETQQLGAWDVGTPGYSGRAYPYVGEPCISNDGCLVAYRDTAGKLRVSNTRTGKDLLASDYRWKGEGAMAFSYDGKKLYLCDSVTASRFVPGQGSRNAVSTTITQFEVKTGKDLQRLNNEPFNFLVARMAIAGQHLLLGGKDGRIRRVHAESGEEVGFFGPAAADAAEELPVGIAGRVNQDKSQFFIVSPDERMAAVIAPADNSVQLWEVASGKQRGSLRGHTGKIVGMSITPDGKHLVTGGADGVVLVWSLTRPAKLARDAPPANDKQLDALWKTVAGNANDAYRAMRKMAVSPNSSVWFLQTRLKSPAAPNSKLIEKLIRQLDSPRFRERELAQKKLADLGETVRPALEKAAKKSTSNESKERLEQLMGQLQKGITARTQIQFIRAIELLEWIGSSDAQSILRNLAKTANETEIAHQARAALRRLKQK